MIGKKQFWASGVCRRASGTIRKPVAAGLRLGLFPRRDDGSVVYRSHSPGRPHVAKGTDRFSGVRQYNAVSPAALHLVRGFQYNEILCLSLYSDIQLCHKNYMEFQINRVESAFCEEVE